MRFKPNSPAFAGVCTRFLSRLIAIVFFAVPSLHSAAALAQGTNLTGPYTWTDTSTTTGESFSGGATITGGATGTFTWSWLSWTGTGTVSGPNWTLTGQSSAGLTASWTGTLSEANGIVTMSGNWNQSDGEVGTTAATGQVAANHLVFIQQPTNVPAGQAINPPVQVQVQNSQNQVVGNSDQITLALGSGGTSGAALGGTVAVTASGGTASFANLSINLPGQGYTLTASDASGASGATSTQFNVTGCQQNGASSPICLTKTAATPALVQTDDGVTYNLPFNVSLTNGTASTLTGITITDVVTPAFNVVTPANSIGTPRSDSVTWQPCKPCTNANSGTITWSKNLSSVSPQGSLSPSIAYTLTTPVVTAANGETLSVEGWTGDGWQGTSAQVTGVQLSGGNLIYSDAPEFLMAGTTSDGGIALNDRVEGVLYKQRQKLDGTPLTSTGNFRLYLNHENRTGVGKILYFLLTNTSDVPVSIKSSSVGMANAPDNPVLAGEEALMGYLTGNQGVTPGLADNQPCAGTPVSVNTTIPPNATCAFVISALLADDGHADVVNLIEDLSASGPVQVGVVVVNEASQKAFEKNPLTYNFQGGGGSRTYLNDRGLSNPGETHVHGTFPYDEVYVTIPYQVNSGNRFGWLLAPAHPESSPQYAPALDMVTVPFNSVYNKGNYGVQYVITIAPSGAQTGMATQVLLNPRGAGQVVTGPKKYTNAFGAVVTTSATTAPFKVPGTDFIKDSELAAGVGYIVGNEQFTLNLIPPGGDATPVAVVLSPAYIKNAATATAGSSTSPEVDVIDQLPNPN